MNKNDILFPVFLIIIASMIGYGLFKEKELSDNKAYTKGRIIDYLHKGGKNYIRYIFYVKGKKYSRETKVFPFKCDNGVKGCVGEKFKVTYSTKDPSNCEIYLGKYNKHRPTRVRIFGL